MEKLGLCEVRREDDKKNTVCVTRLPNGERWGRGSEKITTVASNLSHTICSRYFYFPKS